MRIDLVGTTADFRRFGHPQPLPINHLLCENRRTQGRMGEVGLATIPTKNVTSIFQPLVSTVMASARGSGGSKCWGLCGFADQYAVGGRSCAGADDEQGIEGGMACSAPIEAEHELVKVMLEVCFPQSVIDAQAPTLEV